MENNTYMKKPDWLKVKANAGHVNTEVTEMLRHLGLHTVCEEADCPNCGECFGRRTATFMILGSVCTRNCRFCAVTKGCPTPLDTDESEKIASAVKTLGLKHVVITSVTRDDLADGGAWQFAEVIRAIRAASDGKPPVIEVLIPDFQGDETALKVVTDAKPDILNHNVETVPRLYSSVRPMAIYERSLEVIKRVKVLNADIITKSGIMVGLGEKISEVHEAMRDLRRIGCELLTVGQYLAPSKMHHPVVEYIHPDVFAEYKRFGEEIGFSYVASGPMIRSSYMADEAYGKMAESKIK